MAKFIYYNPNPLEKRTGDCVIRALTKLLDMDWDTVFIDLFTKSFAMKDMMDLEMKARNAQTERERNSIMETIDIIKRQKMS